MPESRSPELRRAPLFAALCALLAFAGLSLWSAWVCDDAYITLRTVHNFVSGEGLRWNVAERVQSYTHPLWMFVLSAVYALTGEPYFTTIFTSLGTPRDVAEQISRETGADVVELSTHVLGGSASYAAFIRTFADAILDALR